ncbi:hypothetical protein WI98_14980 [Burkholderia vietnamiensis]|nr:hypothetical protein WI98_14980 [Burkholderia vietnamiensis]
MLEKFDGTFGTRWHAFGVAFEHSRRRRDPASCLAPGFINAAPQRGGEPLALTLQLALVECRVGVSFGFSRCCTRVRHIHAVRHHAPSVTSLATSAVR